MSLEVGLITTRRSRRRPLASEQFDAIYYIRRDVLGRVVKRKVFDHRAYLNGRESIRNMLRFVMNLQINMTRTKRTGGRIVTGTHRVDFLEAIGYLCTTSGAGANSYVTIADLYTDLT